MLSIPASPPHYRGLRQVDPPKPSNIELPTEFDQRSLFKDSVSINTVLNQLDCGSCWAFGSSSTLSDRLYRANNATNVIVSPQQVVDCSRSCYPNDIGLTTVCNKGCNGGSVVFPLCTSFTCFRFGYPKSPRAGLRVDGQPDCTPFEGVSSVQRNGRYPSPLPALRHRCAMDRSAAAQQHECRATCADGTPLRGVTLSTPFTYAYISGERAIMEVGVCIPRPR